MDDELDIVAFTKEEVAKIAAVRDRLYTENRLNGDDMRDLADQLRLALENGVDLLDIG